MLEATQPAALGVFGGTFDPVHNAHIALAQTAYATLALAEVLWLPSGITPHRPPPRASRTDRLAMLQLALADNPHFQIDDYELTHNEPTYTVNSLLRLRQRYGEARPLVLLLGADAFCSIPAWHRWQCLPELAHLAIADRPDAPMHAALPVPLAEWLKQRLRRDPAALQACPAGLLYRFQLPAIDPPDLSASQVRAALQSQGHSATRLVPAAVHRYIAQHHLYP